VLSSNSGTRYIIVLLLLFSALFVLLSIIVVVKNRTYFVKMSRYLNECRDYAIQNNVIGFDNKSNMWHDYKYPKRIDWFSTQMLCLYLLTLLFMALSICSLGLIMQCCCRWYIIGVVEFAFIVIVACILKRINKN
jgi:hypothetical protein